MEVKSDGLHVRKNVIFIPADFENTGASYMYMILVIVQILQIKIIRLGQKIMLKLQKCGEYAAICHSIAHKVYENRTALQMSFYIKLFFINLESKLQGHL